MRFAFILLCILIASVSKAQKLQKPMPSTGESLPAWAVEMYGDKPNVWSVDDGYRRWRHENPELKTTYTQYYKKWRRGADPFINSKGFIQYPSADEKLEFKQRIQKLSDSPVAGMREGSWSVVGPTETFSTNQGANTKARSEQVNAYSFTQESYFGNTLYCGTEGGEVYVSYNKGESWMCISREMDFNAPTALDFVSSESSVLFVGEGGRIWRQNGQFQLVYEESGMEVNDIKIHDRADDMELLVATNNGLLYTNSGGDFWEKVLPNRCYDVEWDTKRLNVAYTVCHDPDSNFCRFYKSEDSGRTWTARDSGWFSSNDPNRNDGGARIAVSDADSNRIYVVLIGEAKSGDDGFIGIYRSDDGGESWTLPNGPPGGPYDDTNHPNMATIGRTGGYHQGFYNLGLDASDENPDHILAGFLNLWKSTDGGFTWSCIGGYCHNDFNYLHPDIQSITIQGEDVWITSDGGIDYSNDFLETHYAKNNGITGSDYWGFGQGWNEDVMVGGRYHNGNSAQHENFIQGETMSLGGGEAPTGYVNPGPGRKTYFSDIGGVVVPESRFDYAEYFPFGRYPTESYFDAESGEMEWDPRYWSHFYVTFENKLWKTTDDGKSWSIVHEFGSNVDARTMSFEISRSNPDVIYVFQRNANSWDPGQVWKTSDAGSTWAPITMPEGYARRCVLALDAEDENKLWLAYPDADNGQKIYVSVDGGSTWENLTTPALNGEHITYILAQGGTEGGIYLGTYRSVWFKDETMNEWLPFADGLPARISTCILRPFYRDHKLKMASYGKSIWESPFAVPSRPIAQPMAETAISSCPNALIHFDDYSMLDHNGASWSWEFPGGTPSTSSLRNPEVVYSEAGVYDVTLTVTNANGTSTKTVPGMITVLDPIINDIPPLIDFSEVEHITIINPDNGLTWEPVDLTGCNPSGDIAYFMNNYENSSYGQDILALPLNLNLSSVDVATLTFDVAYAPYYDGNAFIDSLHVLVTDDCGYEYDYLLRTGGEELSTTTSGEGPNNLYEYEKFVPANCEEWRHVSIDLTAYAHKFITIHFLSKSGYGNQLYLDNILLKAIIVDNVENVKRDPIKIYPNPTSGLLYIDMIEDHDRVISSTLTNLAGQRIQLDNFRNVAGMLQLDLSGFAQGIYFLQVMTSKGFSIGKHVVVMD